MSMVYQMQGSLNPECVILGFKVVYDVSGVPSVVAGKGIASVADDGTGLFTITTDFTWQHVVGAGGMRSCASAAGGTIQHVADVAASKTIQFRILNDADAAEDPSTDDGVLVLVMLQRVGASVT